MNKLRKQTNAEIAQAVTNDTSQMSHSEAHEEIRANLMEEYKDRAADLERRLGRGHRVVAHKSWKGVALTLFLPVKDE